MKYFLTVVFSVVTFFLYSQVDSATHKGTLIVGGNITGSYSNIKTEIDRSDIYARDYQSKVLNEIEIINNPSIGYFIVNHLAIGGSICLNLSNYDSDSYNEKNQVRFYLSGISTFVKYYSKYGFFANYALVASDYRLKRYEIFGCSFGPGYACFLSNKVSVEASLDYKYSFDGDPHSLKLLIGFQLFL